MSWSGVAVFDLVTAQPYATIAMASGALYCAIIEKKHRTKMLGVVLNASLARPRLAKLFVDYLVKSGLINSAKIISSAGEHKINLSNYPKEIRKSKILALRKKLFADELKQLKFAFEKDISNKTDVLNELKYFYENFFSELKKRKFPAQKIKKAKSKILKQIKQSERKIIKDRFV